MKAALFFASLLWLSGALCRAEKLGYSGPYLGTATPGAERPPRGLAEAVEKADLVLIGNSKTLDTSHYEGIGKGYYAGEIEPAQVLKGKAPAGALSLQWEPSATGIKVGSKHIFFVKTAGAKPEVVKEIFIHDGNYPCCRTYGAMDGGTAVTLDAITCLLSPKAAPPTGFNERLVADMKTDSVHRQATAVWLAAETMRAETLPALLYAVEHRVDYYLDAVFASCVLDGEKGAQTALGALEPVKEGRGRNDQVILFHAIALAANPASIGPLKKLGDAHPEYRVSCAFALRKISVKEAKPIIEGWLADHKQDELTADIYDGWMKHSLSMKVLLTSALQEKDPRLEDLVGGIREQ